MPLHKPTPGIHLQTPENILRVRDASIIRRMPIIIHMNMSASPSASSTPLTTRAARPIASCASTAPVARSLSGLPLPSLGWKHGGAGAEIGAARGSHGAGLGYYIRVSVGMDPDDRLHDIQEAMILFYGGGRGGDRRRGTDCEVRFRGIGGEEGEDVGFVEGGRVVEDVLCMRSSVVVCLFAVWMRWGIRTMWGLSGSVAMLLRFEMTRRQGAEVLRRVRMAIEADLMMEI